MLRDIEPLKYMLKYAKDFKDLIFVDNKKLFEEGINNSSYDDIFIDRFAGDFGHCTQRGNKILAQNIANVMINKILK